MMATAGGSSALSFFRFDEVRGDYTSCALNLSEKYSRHFFGKMHLGKSPPVATDLRDEKKW